MRDYEVFKKWLDGVLSLIWGVPNEMKYAMMKKPKRARGKKGKFLADDPTTAFTNEAWVGGKAPKKRKKK